MKRISVATSSAVFNLAIILPILLSRATTAQQINTTEIHGSHAMLVRKVFVNVTGDPKMAHRLLGFLDLELEDAGLQLMNSEANADAEIDAEVIPQNETHNLGLGVMKVASTANGKTETRVSCEALSSGEDGEFFASSAEGVAKNLREKYPSAKTLRLDSAGDTTSSKVFGFELPNYLKASDFRLVDSGTADVSLRVDLSREKVPVEERVLSYKARIILRDGSRPEEWNGSGSVSARVVTPPELCPERVADLDWLSGQDPLFQLAQGMVKQLRRNNRRANAIRK